MESGAFSAAADELPSTPADLLNLRQTGLKLDRDAPDSFKKEMENFWKPEVNDESLRVLLKNGFVVRPSDSKDLYDLYFGPYPLITIDSAIHAYRILYLDSMERIERIVFAQDIARFSQLMFEACLRYDNSSNDEAIRKASDLATSFFAVAVRLQGATPTVPGTITSRVEEEVNLISQASTIARSPVFGYEVDYTQFNPRGAYEDRRAYFQTMAWYGRTYFRQETDVELRAALFIAETFRTNTDVAAAWDEVSSLLDFLIGPPDDYSPLDFVRIMEKTEAGNFEQALADTGLARIRNAMDNFPSPRISAAYLLWPDSDRFQERTRGMRIFGKRYNLTGHVFQDVLMKCRRLPSGLDIAAAVWRAAPAVAELQKQNAHPLPTEQNNAVSETDPFSNVHQGILWALAGVWEEPKGNVPGFMKTEAWQTRLLNSTLGGWAEIAHDQMLYAKDTGYSMCMSIPPSDLHGYVEPYTVFYERLANLTAKTWTKLEKCGIFERIQPPPPPSEEEKDLVRTAMKSGKWSAEAVNVFTQARNGKMKSRPSTKCSNCARRSNRCDARWKRPSASRFPVRPAVGLLRFAAGESARG